MKTIRNAVMEDVDKLKPISATRDGLRFLSLSDREENYTAANKYIAALEIIRDLTKNELPNYIPASRLTKDEWVKYNWSDVTFMGDPERMIVRGLERLPDEAAAALRDWRFLHDEV